jgi:hypothetical protein
MSGHGDIDAHGELVRTHKDLAPGAKCPACARRIPHPKQPTSPTTKPVSYRVPLDEIEAHQETLDQAARFVGCAEQPFANFKVIALALAVLLQDEKLRGFAQRAA